MIKRYATTLMGIAILFGIISISLVSADSSAVINHEQSLTQGQAVPIGCASGTVCIDFEGLDEGQIVNELTCGSGITCPDGPVLGSVAVRATNQSEDIEPTDNTAMVFDATCAGNARRCSGGDSDLFFPDNGNTMINSEDLDQDDPDDQKEPGSFMEFDFSGFGLGGVTVVSLDVGDIDDDTREGGAFVERSAGPCVGLVTGLEDIPLLVTGDNRILTNIINFTSVNCFHVHLNGSGTVDNIIVTLPNQPGIPSIDIEKSTNGIDADLGPGPVVPIGTSVEFTYVVTNTGQLPLFDVSVLDDQGVTVACPDDFLAVGASMTCTGETIATEGQYTNIGTAFGEDPTGTTVTDTDTSNHFGAIPDRPAIDIEKATNGEDADSAPGPVITVGDLVTFTYVVTNTGNVDLSDISVVDDRGVAVTCFQDTLAPGASMTCTGSTIATEGQYTNIGTASGMDPAGATVSDSDDSNHFGAEQVTPVTTDPGIEIDKSPDRQIVVIDKNNGDDNAVHEGCPDGDDEDSSDRDSSFGGFGVTGGGDDDEDDGECPDDGHRHDRDSNFAVTGGGNDDEDDGECPDNGHRHDRDSSFAVTGGGNDDDDEDEDEEDDNGKCDSDSIGHDGSRGTASFTITVTNIGDVELTDVQVIDPQAPDCDNSIGDLAVGAVVTYECSVVVTESFTNTAIAVGTGPEDAVVTDQDAAHVEVIIAGCPVSHDNGDGNCDDNGDHDSSRDEDDCEDQGNSSDGCEKDETDGDEKDGDDENEDDEDDEDENEDDEDDEDEDEDEDDEDDD